MNVLDRLEKLIAMSASPVEEEARTAAYLATKLIRDHRIKLSLPSGRDVDPWDAEDANPFGPPPSPRRDPPKPPSSPPSPPRSPPRSKNPDAFRLISTKYAGKCRNCGGTYEVGEQVYWKRGEGAIHETCGPQF